jgi:acyl-CoA synthetase (AMP-forming)/AMP-acid ligase II
MTAKYLVTHCLPQDLCTISPSEAATRPAFVCFSSGTTGKSKGVIVTHRNMTSDLRQWEGHHEAEDTRGKMQVAFLPLSHIYGLNVYMCGSLRRGRTTVIIQQFNLDVYLKCIERYRPQDLQLVPPVALLLAKDPKVESYNLSSIRTIMLAAAPLSKELGLAVETRFHTIWATTVHCYRVWGMTETSPAITGLAPECMDRRDTVGSMIPNVEMRVVNPATLEDVPQASSSSWTGPGEI